MEPLKAQSSDGPSSRAGKILTCSHNVSSWPNKIVNYVLIYVWELTFLDPWETCLSEDVRRYVCAPKICLLEVKILIASVLLWTGHKEIKGTSLEHTRWFVSTKDGFTRNLRMSLKLLMCKYCVLLHRVLSCVHKMRICLYKIIYYILISVC